MDPTLARALQSVIYLMPILKGVEVKNFITEPMESLAAFQFFDQSGKLRAALPDLVWQHWMGGQIPQRIGEHKVNFDFPEGWYQMHRDQAIPVTSATASVQVLGLYMLIAGTLSGHMLSKAEGDQRTPERTHLEATFTASEPKYRLTPVESEEELAKLLSEPAAVRISGRIPLSRINLFHTGYWPPTERGLKYVTERMQAFEAGLIPDPRPFNIAEVEGTDLSAVWSEIALEIGDAANPTK